MSEHKPDLNVYGHNQPDERGTARPGIREQGTGEHLDEIRENNEPQTGGMGRKETPKDGPSQGQWHHDDRRTGKDMVHAVDDHPELEETPMPPRHAPHTDEVPS